MTGRFYLSSFPGKNSGRQHVEFRMGHLFDIVSFITQERGAGFDKIFRNEALKHCGASRKILSSGSCC